MGSIADYAADRIDVGIFAVDAALKVVYWNKYMASHSGISEAELLGKRLTDVFPDLPQDWLQRKIRSVLLLKNFAFASWEQRPYLFRFPHSRPITGGIDAMRQNITFVPLKDDHGEIHSVCVTLYDVTDVAIAQMHLTEALTEVERQHAEQIRLHTELEATQGQLMQSEKLAAIGQLAAGVAHEINNPVGFVNSNLATLGKYLEDLMVLVDNCLGAETELPEAKRRVIDEIKQRIDYEFLREDVVALIKESRDGLERVKKIVQDLKNFSRVDSAEWQFADLHACLDSTLNVVANELKYKAEIVKCYGTLPEVECMPSQLNQVFMNLLVNAAQAIPERGTITITTTADNAAAVIMVRDSGVGMSPETIKKIFDPFFTTKPVGKGTGLGLSVSYSIVQRHHGRIEVNSSPGQGSEFAVHLPLRQPEPEAT
jgi:signal transduction histidine kinase